ADNELFVAEIPATPESWRDRRRIVDRNHPLQHQIEHRRYAPDAAGAQVCETFDAGKPRPSSIAMQVEIGKLFAHGHIQLHPNDAVSESVALTSGRKDDADSRGDGRSARGFSQ